MSYRRLWVLIRRLPLDSWVQTELRKERPDSGLVAPVQEDDGDNFGQWALGNYQLATLTDAVNSVGFHVLMASPNEWRREPQPPKPTPRPGAKRAKVRALSPQQVEFLQRMRTERTEG